MALPKGLDREIILCGVYFMRKFSKRVKIVKKVVERAATSLVVVSWSICLGLYSAVHASEVCRSHCLSRRITKGDVRQ